MVNRPTYDELKKLLKERTDQLKEAKTLLIQKEKSSSYAIKVLEYERDLSVSLSNIYDLNTGLQLSLETGIKVSGMDCGGIYLFDEVSGDLNLQVYKGLSEEFIQEVAHYSKDSEHATLVRRGKAAYTQLKDLGVPLPPAVRREGLQAFITVPLRNGDKVVGCLNLCSHKKNKVHSKTIIPVETVAAQIENAVHLLKIRKKLYENEQHFISLKKSASNFAIYRLFYDESSPYKLSVVFVSNSAKDILGIQDPMKFENWFENLHPDDVKRITKANQRAFEKGQFNEEYRIFHQKYGEYRWIHTVSTGTFNEKDWTGFVNGIMIDVTEKHRYQERLKKSEEHLKSLMDSASGFVVYRMARDENDPHNLKMTAVSPSVEEVLGYKPKDFKVSSYYDHIHPDDIAGVMEAHNVAFKTGKFEKTARVYNPKTGGYSWIHAVSIAVYNEEGNVSHVNGLFIDVTEKYKAFNELKAREKELQRKSENLKEMNTALNVLINKMKEEEINLKEKVCTSIQRLILPYVKKLKSGNLDSYKKTLIDIIESNLSEIGAYYPQKLSSRIYSLTPTEIQVANLIKQGKTTKETADTLSISYKTVESHREKIRKKLQISNKKVNLRSYLQSICD